MADPCPAIPRLVLSNGGPVGNSGAPRLASKSPRGPVVRRPDPNSEPEASAPLLSDLPDVVQRIVSGSGRPVTANEMRSLAKLTTEQRCAAIGMECEGYSHDIILNYLLPPPKRGSETKRAAIYRPASPRRIPSPHTTPRGTGSEYARTSTSTTRPISPNGPRISPGRAHQYAVEQQRMFRQGSQQQKVQEREKLRARTHYDARKECQQSPPSSARGSNKPSAPYWSRASTPTTPRRTDGAVQAPKIYGDAAHRSSYLPQSVQMMSYRRKIDSNNITGVDAILMKTFRRSASMTPPPVLRRQPSQNSSVSPDPASPPPPDIVLSSTYGESTVLAGSKKDEPTAAVTTEDDDDDSLRSLSPRRVDRWIEDFKKKLSVSRISASQWSTLPQEKQLDLFQQWRLPQLQRRVIQSRFPHGR